MDRAKGQARAARAELKPSQKRTGPASLQGHVFCRRSGWPEKDDRRQLISRQVHICTLHTVIIVDSPSAFFGLHCSIGICSGAQVCKCSRVCAPRNEQSLAKLKRSALLYVACKTVGGLGRFNSPWFCKLIVINCRDRDQQKHKLG